MATVNSGIREDANFLNLKEIAQKQVKSEVNNMLVTGENIIQCFQTVRDQVVFTDKRVIVVNVQGITGKKTSFHIHTQKFYISELRRQEFWILTAN